MRQAFVRFRRRSTLGRGKLFRPGFAVTASKDVWNAVIPEIVEAGHGESGRKSFRVRVLTGDESEQ